MALPRWAIITLAFVFAFKVFAAAQIALNVDEAYYWVWSLHPAYGYPDEPPMVAWLIWATSFLGSSPLAVRLLFIVCDIVAAIAVGRAATLLSGNANAGAVAAMIVTFIPGPQWLLGQANPDAPFVCFWALALWAILRFERNPNWVGAGALGLALGGAVLSRIFGWALVAGIVGYLAVGRRALWRRGLWISVAIALLLYAPFVAWDAAHGWENSRFTFSPRAGLHVMAVGRFALHGTVHFPIIALAFIAFIVVATVRRKHTLIAWTALPLACVLLLLSPFFNSQSYWLLGPFTSLSVELGIAYTELRAVVRVFWATAGVGTAALAAATILAAALPASAQMALLRAWPQGAQHWLYVTSHAYAPLAAQAKSVSTRNGTAVITNEYTIAAELVYHGVSDPLLAGTDPRGPQWRRWYGGREFPKRAIIITRYPLADDHQLAPRIARAYGRVRPGPVWRFSFAGTDVGTFYTTLCDRPRSTNVLELSE